MFCRLEPALQTEVNERQPTTNDLFAADGIDVCEMVTYISNDKVKSEFMQMKERVGSAGRPM